MIKVPIHVASLLPFWFFLILKKPVSYAIISPHRLAWPRTPAFHAGGQEGKKDNKEGLASYITSVWVMPSILRITEKGLPSGCPFFYA